MPVDSHQSMTLSTWPSGAKQLTATPLTHLAGSESPSLGIYLEMWTIGSESRWHGVMSQSSMKAVVMRSQLPTPSAWPTMSCALQLWRSMPRRLLVKRGMMISLLYRRLQQSLSRPPGYVPLRIASSPFCRDLPLQLCQRNRHLTTLVGLLRPSRLLTSPLPRLSARLPHPDAALR